MKRTLLLVVLLAAGCGGSKPPSVARVGTTTSGQTQVQQNALTYAACMRANGVSNFPDSGASGVIPKESLQQLGVSSSRFRSAQNACRHLLPNGGRGPSAAEIQQVRVLSLTFSRCVRRHGVPGFPDPDSSGRIPDPATVGIDQGSPKFEAANQACGRYRPPYMPSNAAYDAYARTHGG